MISNVGRGIREAKGKFINYKIEHRYYLTPVRPHKFGVTNDDMCWKSKNDVSK